MSDTKQDGEFRLELANVPPAQEIKFCTEKIAEQEKKKAGLKKDLDRIAKRGSYTVHITASDADGEPVALEGQDGETYFEIAYETEGDLVLSHLTMAAPFLKKAMGSNKNDYVRVGSLIHMCDKQIAKYSERIERAKLHIKPEGM